MKQNSTQYLPMSQRDYVRKQIWGYLECSNRLVDSLVVECWFRVQEVPGSIPSQGPRHTKDFIKMVPVVPLFSTQH